jgi:flagellar protein FliT
MAPDDASAWHARPGQHPPRPLIERYREVAQLSREMLDAARRDDWDEVARLEQRCKGLIEHLKRAAMVEPLNAAEQRRRIALLREILQDDAQIRIRAEPWLLELERLIGVTRRTKSEG